LRRTTPRDDRPSAARPEDDGIPYKEQRCHDRAHKADVAESGASVEVSEEFINFPRSIAGVEVAVLFRETSPNRFKVSLRSKTTFDVAKLVAKFGGGGHQHAAGCTIESDLATARKQILSAINEMM
jgi:phosphoesterase RecJ-like protein